MKKSTVVNILLVVAIVAVIGISFAIGNAFQTSDERFSGTDGQATQQIQESDPGYTPWFESLFKPGSAELESGLFAIQAGIGGVVLGFALGALWGRRSKRSGSPSDSASDSASSDNAKALPADSPETTPTDESETTEDR